MQKQVRKIGKEGLWGTECLVHSSSFDSETSVATFCVTFGGFSHYVYSFRVEGTQVVEMTKIWNGEKKPHPMWHGAMRPGWQNRGFVEWWQTWVFNRAHGLDQ
eukprot:TRINITY_DN12112_c0_g1_i2.p3 TRINITY_DN12112_c0_g1~~TRINITY_DN12112_c0_g1_i2.p3  ORF type:complete len:103 (+),score=21.90 TRINITY_DN12112_c0_g1_i2:231-539(+)